MSLAAALQFLTRVPIRLQREVPLGSVMPWLPLAGALIGCAVGGVAAGMWEMTTPVVAAAVAVAVGLLVTGAFHEDGLADVADAFGGGWTVERRLEILADSRHGTYGVAALCASIVIRVACVASLPGPATMFAALVAAHTFGRAGAVALRLVPPAHVQGLGAAAVVSRRGVVGAAATAVAVGALAIGWWVLPVIAATIAGTAAVGVLSVRKIGGVVGDVLGAAEQVVECLCLIVVVALAQSHHLWWR